MKNVFDPDYKERPPAPKPNHPSLPNGLQLMDEQEVFERYMTESEMCRSRHGLGRKEGLFFVADREAINRMDPALRERLRNFCLKMKAKGLWIAEPGSAEKA